MFISKFGTGRSVRFTIFCLPTGVLCLSSKEGQQKQQECCFCPCLVYPWCFAYSKFPQKNLKLLISLYLFGCVGWWPVPPVSWAGNCELYLSCKAFIYLWRLTEAPWGQSHVYFNLADSCARESTSTGSLHHLAVGSWRLPPWESSGFCCSFSWSQQYFQMGLSFGLLALQKDWLKSAELDVGSTGSYWERNRRALKGPYCSSGKFLKNLCLEHHL